MHGLFATAVQNLAPSRQEARRAFRDQWKQRHGRKGCRRLVWSTFSRFCLYGYREACQPKAAARWRRWVAADPRFSVAAPAWRSVPTLDLSVQNHPAACVFRA